MFTPWWTTLLWPHYICPPQYLSGSFLSKYLDKYLRQRPKTLFEHTLIHLTFFGFNVMDDWCRSNSTLLLALPALSVLFLLSFMVRVRSLEGDEDVHGRSEWRGGSIQVLMEGRSHKLNWSLAWPNSQIYWMTWRPLLGHRYIVTHSHPLILLWGTYWLAKASLLTATSKGLKTWIRGLSDPSR